MIGSWSYGISCLRLPVKLFCHRTKSNKREELSFFLWIPKGACVDLSMLNLVTPYCFPSAPTSGHRPARIKEGIISPLKGKSMSMIQSPVSHLLVCWSPQPFSAPPLKARHAALVVHIWEVWYPFIASARFGCKSGWKPSLVGGAVVPSCFPSMAFSGSFLIYLDDDRLNNIAACMGSLRFIYIMERGAPPY